MMDKKKDKRPQPEIQAPSARMSPALWLVPLLAVFALLFYLALSMGYIAPFLLTMYQWKWGLIIIQLVFLALLISSHALDKRSTPAGDEAEEVKAEIVEDRQEAASPPKAKARPTVVVTGKSSGAIQESRPQPPPKPAPKEGRREIVEYPEKVSGGIYADTHLPIGDGRFLKLRTLIARACLLCDEHDKCFTLVRHDMSAEGFNGNIDCKQGLNIEVTRA
jgi:hypothetical protein